MDLDLPRFTILVPEAHSQVVYVTKCQVHYKFHMDDIDLYTFLVLWFDIIHIQTCTHKLAYAQNTNTHRRGPTGWQIHINILLIPPIMISQQLFVLQWMINFLTPTLYFTAGLQCMYFLKTTLSQKSIICEIKSIRRSPWWDT